MLSILVSPSWIHCRVKGFGDGPCKWNSECFSHGRYLHPYLNGREKAYNFQTGQKFIFIVYSGQNTCSQEVENLGPIFSFRRVSDPHLPPLRKVFKQGSVSVEGSSSQGHNFKGLSDVSPLSVMFLFSIFCRCKSRCKLSRPLQIFCGVMDLSGTSLAFTIC